MNYCKALLIFADPVYYPAVQPYGLTILAGALRKRNISTAILLPYMAKDPIQEVRNACQVFHPHIVGFSFRNLDAAGFHYEEDGEKVFIDELIELANAARVNGSVIAVGGSGFAIAPHEILKLTNADIGFIGASENDFAEFCVRIIDEKQEVAEAARDLLSAILPGMSTPKPMETQLGSPDELDLVAVEYAKLAGGTIPIRTKTGCSMKCSYCVVPNIERLNLRPWNDIRDELRMIQEAGLGDRVFIADGEFNLPSIERAIELCNHIRSEFGTTIKWTCYLEGGYVTPDLLTAIREAGCVGISLTIDSFSRPGRIGFIKITGPETAIKATQLCLDSGIHTQINLLFGGPNETLDAAISTARIAKQFNEQGVAVAVTMGLRVYPGTPLAAMVTKDKYAQYYHPCKRVNWLGMFCSPIQAKELATHILPILPPSSTISYTRAIEESENDFYHQLAIGATTLAQRKFKDARSHFTKISTNTPVRLEAKLGFLKAEYGLLDTCK